MIQDSSCQKMIRSESLEKLTRYGNLVYNRFTTLITNDMDK